MEGGHIKVLWAQGDELSWPLCERPIEALWSRVLPSEAGACKNMTFRVASGKGQCRLFAHGMLLLLFVSLFFIHNIPPHFDRIFYLSMHDSEPTASLETGATSREELVFQ